MIDLPDGPRTAIPALIDYGFLQRGAIGSKTKRIDRKGSRYKVAFSMGPFYPAEAQVFVSDLLAGKSEGVRVPFPLLESQSGAGSPVVDGAGQEGTTLNLRGLTPGYACKRFWLSIEDENGRHYLHNVKVGGRAAADGTLSVTVTPELRHPFLDGATVHLARPMIEGFVDGVEWSWAIGADKLVLIEFTVEEAE